MTEAEKTLELFEGDFTNGGIIEFTNEEIIAVRKALQGVDYRPISSLMQEQFEKLAVEHEVLKAKSQMLLKVLTEIANDGFYPHAKSEFMKPDMYKMWAKDAIDAFNSDETGVGS